MKPILEVQNISKKFFIGGAQERYLSLRDLIANPFKKLSQPSASFWALKDVSFNVMPGQSIGIIGRNGAGKSTLLKILSKITPPTSGKIISRGRIASLLEVGTGFHPELTGRENTYMNGSILGMRKWEIDKHFDEIVEFSGVKQFLDMPLKRYSSGMQLRLAFAVAAYLEPEILVIDEILAVGDAEFQKKCLGKMNEVSQSGRTVLFVSHDMGAMQTLCSSCILLHNGTIRTMGDTSKVITEYLSSFTALEQWEQTADLKKPHVAKASAVLNGKQPTLNLDVSFTVKSPIDMVPSYVVFNITNSRGLPMGQAIPTVQPFIDLDRASNEYAAQIDLAGFVPDDYMLSIWIGPHNNDTYDFQREIISFTITDSPQLGRTFPHYPSDHGNLIFESRML